MKVANMVKLHGGEILEFMPTARDINGQKIAELDHLMRTRGGSEYAIECKSWDWRGLSPKQIENGLKDFISAAKFAKKEYGLELLVVTPDSFNIAHIPNSEVRSEIISLLKQAKGEKIQFFDLYTVGKFVYET